MPSVTTVKLNHDNFLLWKAQLIPYFKGQDLFGYLDGSNIKPPKLISVTHPESSTISECINPAYSHWVRQDNLILSTLMTSLSEPILAQVVNYTTSKDVWYALEDTFSSRSRARTLQIRTQLATATKGNQTEYFNSIKRLTDELAVAGNPLDHDDILTYILAGLNHEYDSLVASISARPDAISLEELYSLLLTSEARLSRHQLTPAISPPSAHFAQRQNFYPRRGGFRERGRSHRGGYNSSNRTPQQPSNVCQICNKYGHLAKKCYYRFDLTYQDAHPLQTKNGLVAIKHGSNQSCDTTWTADTGATHHFTNDIAHLSLQKSDYDGADHVQIGNGQGLQISKSGSSIIYTPSSTFVLNHVLLVPEIRKNLLSIHQFCVDNNVYFEFHSFYFLVKDYSGKVLHRGYLHDGLYQFTHKSSLPQALSSVRSEWHRRLGHASNPVLNKVLTSLSFPVEKNKTSHVCPECQMAKSHSLPFKKSNSVSLHPLDLIFTDVWGPASVLSTSGAKYYVSFLDDYSKFLWLFPLKLKSDVENVFLNFQTYVEKQFDRKIKAIQSDWGGEYRRLNTYFHKIGINHRVACPHTHQQNGSIERKHRHIVEVGLSLLAHSNLPMIYWEDAFQTATYIINRLPTPVLNQKSPFEILYNKIPDYRFMRVFGCACWPNL
jgi:histone deacetylase 1/2